MLNLQIFTGQNAAKELTAFVNDNEIAKADVVNIQVWDGFWYLMYWSA